MTDARFPERWLTDRRFAKISAEAFRLHMVTIAWCAANRTDGAIEWDELNTLLPRWVDNSRAQELANAELWAETDQGWRIVGFANTQTTAAELDAAEHARSLARQRKARERARKRESTDEELVPRDVTADVTQSNTGQARDRTGHDRRSASEGQMSDFTDAQQSARAPSLSDDKWATEWGAPNPDDVANLNGRRR